MSSLLAGAVGTIVALQSASHLNGNHAVIVRSATADEERHCVFIVSSSSSSSPTASRFVRLKPQNFRVTSSLSPSHGSSRYESPTLSMHPLTARPLHAIEAVFDYVPDSLPGYKYFSPLPPTYLFASTRVSDTHSYSSLQLCSTDLTHSLYSLHHLGETDAPVHFTLNACDATTTVKPSVIARNLVMLWLILHTKCPTFVVAEIWFSLRLSELAYAYLLDAVFVFTRGDAPSLLEDLGVVEIDDALLRAVLSLMDEWVRWHSSLSSWDAIMRARDERITRLINASRPPNSAATTIPPSFGQQASESLIFSHHMKGETLFPKEQVRSEIRHFFKTGCLRHETKCPQLYTNPTLFQDPSPSKYNMFGPLLPYTCAPSFCARYDRTHPLHSLLLSSLARWVQCLRSRARSVGKVTWAMHATTLENTPAFCMGLTRRHDFAFVGNLCETIGLLPILQSLRGVVEHSVLACSDQIFDAHDSSQRTYVQRFLLNTPPEIAPALLGWRCLGCDGNQWKTVFPGTDRRDLVQYMLWVPVASADNELSLDLAQSKTFETLFRSVRKKMLTRNNVPLPDRGRHGHLSVYDKEEEYHTPIPYSALFTHPFVFLPLFAAGWHDQANLSAMRYLPDNTYNAEFRDVLRFSVGDSDENLHVASIALPRELFRAWGKVALSRPDGSFECDVYSVHANGVPYYGLNIAEGLDDVTFSWLMDRRRLHGAGIVQVVYGVQCVITDVPAQAVKFASVSRSELNAWIHRNLCAGPGSTPTGLGNGIKVTRVERQSDMDVVIRSEGTRAMSVDIEAGGKSSGIQIVVKHGRAVHRHVFSVPYKLCATHTTKVLGNANGFKVVVTIEKSGAELASPCILQGAQTDSMWFHDDKVPAGYIFWMLPQTLSPEESVRGMLNRSLWTKQVFCKSVIYSMLHSASRGNCGTLIIEVDENSPVTPQRPRCANPATPIFERASKRQMLRLDIVSGAGTGTGAKLWRHEQTGTVGLKLKWSFHPRMMSPREMRRQAGFNVPPCVSRAELMTLVAVLESRAVGKVQQRKEYHDMLVHEPGREPFSPVGPDIFEMNRMSEKMFQVGKGSLSKDQEESIQDEVLLSQGCKIATSFLAFECWDGQVDLLAPGGPASSVGDSGDRTRNQEHDSLPFAVTGTEWIHNMRCWFHKAQQYGTADTAQVEKKLASLDMGLTHGLPFVDPIVWKQMLMNGIAPQRADSDDNGEGLRTVVKCLVQGAQCRDRLGKQDLVVPYLNKALHLIERGYDDKELSPNDNEVFQLESTAQRLLTKAVDRPSR